MILNTGSRTDIPAFYSDWFYNRIQEGYCLVRNPYYPEQTWMLTDAFRRREMKPCLLIRTNDKIAQTNETVRTLAKAHHAHYIDINAPLKDEQGNLKAEYTIEGMHIKEQGYRAIFDSFIKYALED